MTKRTAADPKQVEESANARRTRSSIGGGPHVEGDTTLAAVTLRSRGPSETLDLTTDELGEVDDIVSELPIVIDGSVDQIESQTITPKRRGRFTSLRRTPNSNKNDTPSREIGGIFSTPLRVSNTAIGTPSIPRNADRSARRKSAKSLVERTLGELDSDNEEDELAQNIYDQDQDNFLAATVATEEGDDFELPVPTPTKIGRGKRNAIKARARSLTPPVDLAPHELYFSQNKSTHAKTSNNTLSGLSLLTHEEYFTLMRDHKAGHEIELSILHDMHTGRFAEWMFELSQDFSVMLYGYGTKQKIVTSFANHLSKQPGFSTKHKIIIVNGYVHNATIRDVLNTMCQAITGCLQKLGSQPVDMLETVLDLLAEDPEMIIYLLINSIDSTALRRPATQLLLSRLAAHGRIRLLGTADSPNFPLLYNNALTSTFNFVYHDCTTYRPYDVELDVVDEVHTLLGRSGRRVGGKEGVAFVLKSLPVKARQLYGVLVAEQLASMDEDIMADVDAAEYDDDEDEFGASTSQHARIAGQRKEAGVEYRVLYLKAVEDFICPNEMTFRTLLKEFYDHQMITSKKDGMGIELLSVPFCKEELETILEEIMA